MHFSRAIGPCRSLPSVAGRLIVLMSSWASFAATDSNRWEDWGRFVGDRAVIWTVPALARGRVGGAVTGARSGWIFGGGVRRPPLSPLLDSDRHCAECLQPTAMHAQPAYTRTVHSAIPPFLKTPKESQPRQPSAGAVDTRPVDAGAGFRAVFEETVCQGNHAKTGGRLPMHVKRSYERPTRVYESLREFTQKKNGNNQ